MSRVLQATLTCPACGACTTSAMPLDACVQRFVCPSCATTMTPAQGDCCVFCTHGDHICPPRQDELAR